MSAPAAILMYGRDPQLIDTRRMVLERSGYKVLTTMNLAEIDRITAQSSLDLLILCYTLSMAECDRALASAHSQRPAIKSLVLVAGGSGCSSAQQVDGVFDAMEGPARLISTVGRLVSTPGSTRKHVD